MSRGSKRDATVTCRKPTEKTPIWLPNSYSGVKFNIFADCSDLDVQFLKLCPTMGATNIGKLDSNCDRLPEPTCVVTQPLPSILELVCAEWFKKLREPVTFRAPIFTCPTRIRVQQQGQRARAPTGVQPRARRRTPLPLELTLLSRSTKIQTGSSAASDSQNKDGRRDKLSNRELNEVSAVSQSIC